MNRSIASSQRLRIGSRSRKGSCFEAGSSTKVQSGSIPAARRWDWGDTKVSSPALASRIGRSIPQRNAFRASLVARRRDAWSQPRVTAQAEERNRAAHRMTDQDPRPTRRRYRPGEQREFNCVTVEAARTWATRKAPRTLGAALPAPIKTPHREAAGGQVGDRLE